MSVPEYCFCGYHKRDPMKRLVVGLLVLAWSGVVQAYGLPYAVNSFKKAQALSQQRQLALLAGRL